MKPTGGPRRRETDEQARRRVERLETSRKAREKLGRPLSPQEAILMRPRITQAGHLRYGGQ